MICCSFICVSLRESTRAQQCGSVFSIVVGAVSVLCVLTNAIWATVDWIRVLAGGFSDGNGVALKDW